MLSIEEKILTLNTLRLLPVAALRFTFYAFYRCPTVHQFSSLPHNIFDFDDMKHKGHNNCTITPDAQSSTKTDWLNYTRHNSMVSVSRVRVSLRILKLTQRSGAV